MRVTFRVGVGLGGNLTAHPGETHDVPDAFGRSLIADGRAVRATEAAPARAAPTPPETVETRDPIRRRKR